MNYRQKLNTILQPNHSFFLLSGMRCTPAPKVMAVLTPAIFNINANQQILYSIAEPCQTFLHSEYIFTKPKA
jgi:hypothetical protein